MYVDKQIHRQSERREARCIEKEKKEGRQKEARKKQSKHF
jgi:hypothetical protein